MSRIVTYFYTPVFPDESKARAAALLHFILATGFIVTVLSLIGRALANDSDSARLARNLIILAVELGLFVMLRVGYVRAAGMILMTAGWLIVFAATSSRLDILNPAFGGFTLVVVTAGLLINGWAALVFTGLSVGFGFWLVKAAESGAYPLQIGGFSAQLTLTTHTSVLVLAGLFLFLTQRGVRLAHERSQRDREALRASEEQYRQLFESNPHPMYVLDMETLKFLAVNDASIGGYGYSRQEFLSMSSRDIRPPEDMTAVMQQVGKFQSQNLSFDVTGPWQHRKKDGTILRVETAAHRLTYQGRDAVLIAAYDLTARLLAEENQRVLLQVDKEREVLGLKEKFISTMSHEFRTPLTVILSAKETLQLYSERLTPEGRLAKLELIGEQVRYVSGMLDEVLTLSEARSGKMRYVPTPLDFSATCRKFFDQIQVTDTKQHQFVFDNDGQIGEAVGDAHLLQHILVNLLSNAAKYSPDGSVVRFAIRRDGDEVVIQISDQGIGIPEHDQKYLYEPFFRAGNVASIKGTGLGLSIVKESVEAYRGTISVDSAPGKGTTFTVRLPLGANSN